MKMVAPATSIVKNIKIDVKMIKFDFKKNKDFNLALKQLYEIIVLLRSPDGCPWDRAETQEKAIINLKDELYELQDEINKDNNDGMIEELGDVLINALMLLKISFDDKGINPADVADSASEKLLSRHPHVFGSLNANDAVEALSIWNKQKEKEGKSHDKDDFFSRIPKSKGSFERTIEVNKRAKKAGFDCNNSDEIFSKHDEELNEVKHALKEEPLENLKMELGDLLFTCISLADNLGCDADECLNMSIRKFERRFNALYRKAKDKNIDMKQSNSAILNKLWDDIKNEEHL